MNLARSPLQRPDDEGSGWPYAALLGFGYFGSGTAVGRQHRRRSYAGLALFAIAAMGAASPVAPWALRVACATAIPVAWGFIVWSTARYTSSLDELSRLIQLEAAALSYGVTVVLASIWFALGALRVVESISVASSPAGRQAGSVLAMVFFGSMMLAEVGRGVLLVVFARRRR